MGSRWQLIRFEDINVRKNSITQTVMIMLMERMLMTVLNLKQDSPLSGFIPRRSGLEFITKVITSPLPVVLLLFCISPCHVTDLSCSIYLFNLTCAYDNKL